MVLVSHNVVESMDGSYPASLSPIVHDILRNDLGFDGVIITDDLAMHGVRDYVTEEQLGILAYWLVMIYYVARVSNSRSVTSSMRSIMVPFPKIALMHQCCASLS